MVFQNRQEILTGFEGFRNELDERNDRRERLIKMQQLSREITVNSKRVIFLLHRIVTDDESSATAQENGLSKESKAAKTAQETLHHIRRTHISQLRSELDSEFDYWQHQKNVTPGIQEYIEAVSYAFFLETNRLIKHEDMMLWLSDDEGVPFLPLPFNDFILGLSDLTGELMRLCITSIARGSGRSKAGEVCDFVRRCSADFETLTSYMYELSKKQQVTVQSLRKIEEANYALKLRSAEYGNMPEVLDELVRRSLSKFLPPTFSPDNFDGLEENRTV